MERLQRLKREAGERAYENERAALDRLMRREEEAGYFDPPPPPKPPPQRLPTWFEVQLRRYHETPETVKQSAGDAYDRWVARSLVYKGMQMALVVMPRACTLYDGSHIVQIEPDRPIWLPATLVSQMLPNAAVLAHASPA
jgi:hypothetical protein